MRTHSTIHRLATSAALFGGLALAPLAANAEIPHYADVVHPGTAHYEVQANGSRVYAGRAGQVSLNKNITTADSETRVAKSPNGEVFLPRVGYVKIKS